VAMSITIAAFDVDNTLTVRDCVVPFMRSVAGTGRLARVAMSDIRGTLRFVFRRDRDALKQKFVKGIFAGRTAAEIENLGVQFASKVADGWLREDVSRRLRWHQVQGHVVILVSASLGVYLHPLGDLLEVDAVLCTELEVVNGVFTGQLLGPNCRGAEKVSRIRHWCEESGFAVDDLVFAYGDSAGDTQMLEAFTNPTWVSKVDIEMEVS